MKTSFKLTLFILPLLFQAAYGLDLRQNSSASFRITTNGQVTQTAKCVLTALANQNVTLPDSVYVNLKTNEQVDALFPFMTLANPRLPASTANSLSTTLFTFAGYNESQPFTLNCDLNANNMVTMKVGALANGNIGVFSGTTQSDLMLNFSAITGQTLTDYRQIFRVAVFLMVESNSTKEAYRLDLAKASADPTNTNNITSKIKVAPSTNSTFRFGFLLTRRSRDYDNNYVFNWIPSVAQVNYSATLPIILSFN